MKKNNFLILFCSGYSLITFCMENSSSTPSKTFPRKAISQPLYTRRPRIFTLENITLEQKQPDNGPDNSQVYMAMLDQWSENHKKQELKRSQSK